MQQNLKWFEKLIKHFFWYKCATFLGAKLLNSWAGVFGGRFLAVFGSLSGNLWFVKPFLAGILLFCFMRLSWVFVMAVWLGGRAGNFAREVAGSNPLVPFFFGKEKAV